MSELDAIEFLDQQPRCACVLLLDTSASMNAQVGGTTPIAELNEGLKTFSQELSKDDLAQKRVEVAIVEFNSKVNVVQDFIQAQDFFPPTLKAEGSTAMGKGIEKAAEMVETRKHTYKNNGVTYYRPWIFMITDGQPTDTTDEAIRLIAKGEESKSFAFFAVGVQTANMEKLAQISVRSPLKLEKLNFSELFVWLSASMKVVSQSNPGEQIAMEKIGWATL
jgi:uncharacterized protein YegL